MGENIVVCTENKSADDLMQMKIVGRMIGNGHVQHAIETIYCLGRIKNKLHYTSVIPKHFMELGQKTRAHNRW